MTRKARDAQGAAWSRWGTPYLDRPRAASLIPTAPVQAAPALTVPERRAPAQPAATPAAPAGVANASAASAALPLAPEPLGAVGSELPSRLLSPESLRRAIHAEEQRQVFALLGRLRRSRSG